MSGGHTWRITWSRPHGEFESALYYAPTAADAATMWLHDANRARSYPPGPPGEQILSIVWLEGVHQRG